MTITAVGSPVSFYNFSGNTSLAVNPTAIGDVLVVSTIVTGSDTNKITALSCPKVASWTHLAGSFNGITNFSTFFGNVDFWLGVVTSTGSTTITFTPAASLSFVYCSYAVQQFHSSVAGVTWAADGSGFVNPAATTTTSWPSLTPGGSNELYWGLITTDGTINTTGQTSGYTIFKNSTATTVGTMYNPNVSTVQAPTSTQASGRALASSVLIKAVPAAPTINTGQFMSFFGA